MKNDLLAKNNLKNTKPRQAIIKVLEKANHPLTAEEIFFALKNKEINLSTVYRTLNTFAQNDIVKKETNQNKENIFLLNQHDDHHILVCIKCHKIVHLEGCPYQKANLELEKQTGFHIHDHNTEIYGICPNCQKTIN